MLVRTRRYYTGSELVVLYKSHLLSYIEYRTPAIYHATRDILCRLDRIQDRFLEHAGIDEQHAWIHFHLAPLATRRDIAMLGVLHRRVIGKGPPPFKKHFELDGYWRLQDPRAALKGPLVIRSILGLVAVYHMLPVSCKRASTAKQFQTDVQNLLRRSAENGYENWKNQLSPRVPLRTHPLMEFR